MKRRSAVAGTLFFFLILLHEANGNPLQYYSSFKFGNIVIGEEHLIKDYLTLDNDPKENLPKIFTICSSVFVKYPLSQTSVFQTSLPYFGVKLSYVCLMFAYSYPKVT